MPDLTDDLRILDIKPLDTPAEVMARLPADATTSATVAGARRAMHNILHGEDDRLIVDRTELEDARWFTREEVASAMASPAGGGAFIPPPPVAVAHHLLKWWLKRGA